MEKFKLCSPRSSPSAPEPERGTGFSSDAKKDVCRTPRATSNQVFSRPIEWRYLTFETEISLPRLQQTCEGAPQPPGFPNLKKYGNPLDWSSKHKSIVLWISCIASAMTAYTGSSYSPGVEQMSKEWHISHVVALVGITVYTCGFAVAPMFLAPFSEINGRRPVFLASGILFVICQLCCAVTQNYSGMLISRFLTGVGGSTFSTMVGGVVSDIYDTADRNTPMSVLSGAALLGTGLGPLTCGWIVEFTTWRWIFYAQAIADGILMVVTCICFKETRGSVLISRKAKLLNQWYEACEVSGYQCFGPSSEESEQEKQQPLQRIRWKVKSDEERENLTTMIKISLCRPFRLLFTEPVVFFFALWISFSLGILYLFLDAIPLVFEARYNMTPAIANSTFAVVAIFAILSTLLSIFQEKWNRRKRDSNGSPEDRLYFAGVGGVFLPIGLFIFGWTSTDSIHWIVPTIGIGFVTVGIFSVYLAIFNYLADVYHRYSSSALAAQSFCRNAISGAFPLITTRMYKELTYGGASSLLGGIGVILSMVPWVLIFYGPRIRRRSRFAGEIMED